MRDATILAQLRHAYSKLVTGSVTNQKMFADGLIAPVIKELESRQLCELRKLGVIKEESST